MRPAHFLPPVFLAAALAVAVPAGAQPPLPAPPTAPADHMDTVAAAPVHVPLPTSGDLATPSTGWRSAHTAVGAFPRGHADIVAWEAAQARSDDEAAPDSALPHPHHGMLPHTSHSHPGGQP